MSFIRTINFKGLSRLLCNPVSSLIRRNYVSVSNLQVDSDKKTLAVEFDGKERRVYHAVWLKHFCHCVKCRDPTNGQSQQSPGSLRDSYKLRSVVTEGDNIEVSWEDDEDADHKGTFPIKWLNENAYGEDVLKKLSREARPVPLKGKLPEFDYKELTRNPSKRLEWLLRIYEDGLSMLKNVPNESQYVIKVANFVHSNAASIYGDYFDIITHDSKEDVAYSQIPLSLHMDEPYYESPPGITLLHCLRFDDCVDGGRNVMVDGFAVAEKFRRDCPDEFDTLTRIPVIMGRVSTVLGRPVHMLYYRPHIVLGFNGEIVGINWTNIMQYGVCAPHDMMEPYYHARFRFNNFIEDFEIRHTIRLNPGDLLIFNNRRILHSRTTMQLNGGERHLQRANVNLDDFKSEVLAQCVVQGHPLPKARVGNQDYVC